MQRAPTTNMMVAKRSLHKTLESVADWATDILVQGRDTFHIRRIAGFTGQENPFEVEETFDRALQELGIALPDDEEAAILYAQELAREFLDGIISRRLFLKKMSQHCVSSDYPWELCPLNNLRWSFEDIEQGYESHEYNGATAENFDEIFDLEVRRLLNVTQGTHTFTA